MAASLLLAQPLGPHDIAAPVIDATLQQERGKTAAAPGEFDVIIVGAGIAGCAASVALARQGRRVLCVERDLSEPNRIVGELLQPGGVQFLTDLGLGACLSGIDSPVCVGYAVFPALGAPLALAYPWRRDGKARYQGRSFHHGRFVMQLRAAVQREPNVTLVEGSVRELIEARDPAAQHLLAASPQASPLGASSSTPAAAAPAAAAAAATIATAAAAAVPAATAATTTATAEAPSASALVASVAAPRVSSSLADPSSGDTTVLGIHFVDADKRPCYARAPLTIVSDGCHSQFRKDMVTTVPFATSRFVGLILHTRLPFPDHGHVILTEPCPVLMYAISSSEIRCLVDVPLDSAGRMPSAQAGELARYLLEHVAPQLPEPLRMVFIAEVEAIRDAEPPNCFPSMANATLYTDPFVRRGTLLLGDSFNMRHPLTGGGMSVAFNDVKQLASVLQDVDLRNPARVEAALKRYYKLRYPLAATINVLASGLYSVFRAYGDPLLPAMRAATFRWFQFGGPCISDTMGMLGALRPSPLLLICHFYAVAVVAAGMVIFEDGWFPWPSRVVRALRVVWSACQIILPVLRDEGVLSLSHWTPRKL